MARPPNGDEPSEPMKPRRAGTRGLQAGECIAGRYELVSKLGQGGSGEVWKAVHRRLGINVAIKTPLVRDSETLERFRREAQALCLIDSEHVLRCFEYGETPIPFLVMELLKGESLADRLERVGPMPLSTVKIICRQLCKGLQAAHRIGVIHRDLKPSNIYCVEDRFKIVDFGLMKLVESTQEPATQLLVTGHDELTRANAFMGTLVYMSPEQLEHANRVDFRSDLWSLSVVLYRLLTAQQPFAAKADYQICLNIAEEPHPPVSKWNPELSLEADVFFQVALAKDPARRFSSAAQLAEAFSAIPELGESPIVQLINVIRNPAPLGAGRPSPSHLSPSSKVRLEEMSTVPVNSARPSAPPSPSVEPHADAPMKRLDLAVMAPSVHREVPSAEHSNHAEQEPMHPRMERDTESSLSVSEDRPSWIGGPTRTTLASAVALAILIAGSGSAWFAFSKSGCEESMRDCDGNLLNGCETRVTTVEHCGVCGLSCTNPHGSTTCEHGTCSPVCAKGYADCDGSSANGCEASLASIDNCGACNVRCANEHGSTACEAGQCSPQCAPGYASCDKNQANGCEAKLSTDIDHCRSQ